MILDSCTLSAARFEDGTGWTLKPRGACRGEVCVPLPDVVHDGRIDLAVVGERLYMPLVESAADGLWSLGPASLGGHVLATAEAPELEFPDLEGRPVRQSSLKGQKSRVRAENYYHAVEP